MAKPKAPRWLTISFRDGVDERDEATCWLAQHDDRPCHGRLERFHFIGRQRVSGGMGALLPWGVAGTEQWNHFADLILLAQWDCRNGGIACETHHRRLDGHMTPPLVIPQSALPEHVMEFAEDWGLESELGRRFPAALREWEVAA